MTAAQQMIAAYTAMRRIREFETRVRSLVNENRIAGVTHEYIGQEAVAVGVCSVLDERDFLTSTHRGHGHLLARGASSQQMMSELFARVDGLNSGRGGSMHIADVSLGILGANGMVGAGAPIACGAAWGSSNGAVAVAFSGDGALNQGVLLESMNLAATWKLPVVFVCENNGYAVTTSHRDSMIVTPVQRAAGFGIPGVHANGMDVDEVRAVSTVAIQHCRDGNGPYFLDLECYRYVGHHTAEETMSLTYRGADEIGRWKLLDPLLLSRVRLIESGVTDTQLNQIDDQIRAEIDYAVEHAEAGTPADPSSALDFAYADSDYDRFPEWGAVR